MNNEELTCRTSEHGPEVTASPRPEYDDFTRSLREHVVAGEKLSAAIPPPLQSAAAESEGAVYHLLSRDDRRKGIF